MIVRSELSQRLHQRFPQLNRGDIDVAVGEILGAIGQQLAKGGRVEVRGFGSFALNYRPPRLGRNPMTGERVAVPAKWTPHFKAGKELRELVMRP
uniref:Histone-like bacterial DNA-binding protein n=1 Tax=Dechloromonas aromatica (strain RCB) TaxID=159087 RepID=Q47FH4_DECAR